MCEFCDYYHSTKGGVSGKSIKISKCANETDLTDCTVVSSENDNPCMAIFSNGMAKGYFEVAYCPICGEKLSNEKSM